MGISFVYEPIVNGVWGFGHGKACDEKGRFVGHLPGLTDDDETLDPHDQRFANEDNLWDQVPSCVYSDAPANGYEPDYSDGYVSRYAELTDEERALAEELWLDPWDTSREELTRLWCERKYPEYFPTEDVTHESISAEEAAIYSFCMDNWEFFHPELLDDEEVSTAASSQSNEQHDDYLKKLGWYAERSDRGWRQAHGKHGRQNSTERQKKREANRTIRKTFRTVDGRQQIAAENDWMAANYWSADMADLDGQMTFWTKHPEGQTADYYRRLLAVNHITQELKSEWLVAYGEYDEWAELDAFRFDAEGIDEPYQFGEYIRRPAYDWRTDEFTTPKNLSVHGWHYFDLSYHEQRRFLEREHEEERLQEMVQDREDWMHRRFMANIYGYPFDDFDDYVGPSLRDDHDEEEDCDHPAMADAQSDGWDDLDKVDLEEERDAKTDATPIAQFGGARGIKARGRAHTRPHHYVNEELFA